MSARSRPRPRANDESTVAYAVEVLRGPKRTPVAQVIAEFRNADIDRVAQARRPVGVISRRDAFEYLESCAESLDLTLLAFIEAVTP